MNNDEFQRYVMQKLDNIDEQLKKIEHRLTVSESNFRWMKGIIYFLVAVLGVMGGLNLHFII